MLALILLGLSCFQDRNNLCAFKIGNSDAILLSLSNGWMWYNDRGGWGWGERGMGKASQVALI